MKRGRQSKNNTRYRDDDWDAIVGVAPISKKKTTYLERQITRHDKQDKKLITQDDPSKPDVAMSKIYKLVAGAWTHIGFKCHECEKTMSDMEVVRNHKNICKRINTLSKETEDMPVQQVRVDGKIMYRWGDHGKAYPTKQEAEAQARAAYASGYKGKQEKK